MLHLLKSLHALSLVKNIYASNTDNTLLRSSNLQKHDAFITIEGRSRIMEYYF